MTTARDIMHPGAECIGAHETLDAAARKMRELDVGSLPICGDDDRLHGIVTDRDIVVKCLAIGDDPATMTAGELAQGSVWTTDADTEIADVLHEMEQHQIRRIPVLDEYRLVGVISEADVARNLPDAAVAHFVEQVCAKA